MRIASPWYTEVLSIAASIAWDYLNPRWAFFQRADVASTRLSQKGVAFARPAQAPAKPSLRAVAWTGNILICVFVFGFGSWSVLAPLKSAAIASGGVEPQ